MQTCQSLFWGVVWLVAWSHSWGQLPPQAPQSSIIEAELQQAKKALTGVRSLQCELPQDNFPRWVGFPVQKCVYSDSGVTSSIWALNPSIDLLARWTVTACRDAQAKSQYGCISALARRIKVASSGIFPVDGFIPEPATSAGGSGDEIHCYRFRDGVTVPSPESSKALKPGQNCPDVDPRASAPVKARKFARVASTTRQQYLDAGGTQEVGTDATGDSRWIDVIRESYQKAWMSDRNELISAAAKSMRP